MAHFAQLDSNNHVVQVIVLDNNDILDENGDESEALGLAFCRNHIGDNSSVWKQTHYSAVEGKGTRGNYAGVGYTYDRDKDAFVPPQPYPSFVLNETTQRYEPPIPYPTGLNGGPQRFIWDEEHYQEYGEWFDRWDTSDSHSQYNPDSKYYLEDLPKYEDDDYPFDDIEQTW